MKLNSEEISKLWDEIKSVDGVKQKLENILEEKLENEKQTDVVANIKKLKDIDIVQEKIKSNFETIMKKVHSINERQELVNLLVKIQEVNVKVEEYLKTGLNLENAQKGFIDEIVKIDNTIQDTRTKQAIYLLLREVIEHEGKKIDEVETVGMGNSANVLRIGNFVMKFQDSRKNDRIKYHPRVLQPVVRTAVYDYENGNKNDKPSMYIEMYNIVRTNWYDELSQEEINEELYKIYREMREDGVVWTDIKKENVGKLIKDNKANYTIKGEELKVEDESIGIYGRNKEGKILQKGELVILDVDYIYTEKEYEELKENEDKENLYYIFDERYKNEKEEER